MGNIERCSCRAAREGAVGGKVSRTGGLRGSGSVGGAEEISRGMLSIEADSESTMSEARPDGDWTTKTALPGSSGKARRGI
jgi:hypothetical protein